MAASTERRQAPLKIDPATDELISQGAHFLGVTKKDLVAAAVRDYLALRRDYLRTKMAEAMDLLDGSTASSVSLLSGASKGEIDRLGGTAE
jgi:hypothetical protein